MLGYLRELYRYRELLGLWTQRYLRVRYKEAWLGVAWAVLQPLGNALILTLVFSVFIRVPSDNIPFPIFIYCGLVVWTFFSGAVNLAAESMTGNINLVGKIYFPREIFPLAAVLASLVDFAFAFIVLAVLMAVYRVPPAWPMVLLPILVVLQALFTASVALAAAAANVFYRDMRFIIPLVLQLWMYLSPVIYPLSIVPEGMQPFYMLNPMASLVQAYRQVLLQGEWPHYRYLAWAGVVSLGLLAAAYLAFKRAEGNFADVV